MSIIKSPLGKSLSSVNEQLPLSPCPMKQKDLADYYSENSPLSPALRTPPKANKENLGPIKAIPISPLIKSSAELIKNTRDNIKNNVCTNCSTHVCELLGSIKQLNAMLINLKEDSEMSLEKYNDLQEEGARLYVAYESKCQRLKQNAKKIEKMEQMMQAAEQINDEYNQLYTAYEELMNAYTVTKSECEELGMQYSGVCEEKSALKSKIDLLNANTSGDDSGIVDMQERCTQLNKMLEENKEMISTYEGLLKKYKEEANEKDEAREELEGKLNLEKDSMIATQNEVNQLKERVETLNEQMETVHAKKLSEMKEVKLIKEDYQTRYMLSVCERNMLEKELDRVCNILEEQKDMDTMQQEIAKTMEMKQHRFIQVQQQMKELMINAKKEVLQARENKIEMDIAKEEVRLLTISNQQLDEQQFILQTNTFEQEETIQNLQVSLFVNDIIKNVIANDYKRIDDNNNHIIHKISLEKKQLYEKNELIMLKLSQLEEENSKLKLKTIQQKDEIYNVTSSFEELQEAHMQAMLDAETILLEKNQMADFVQSLKNELKETTLSSEKELEAQENLYRELNSCNLKLQDEIKAQKNTINMQKQQLDDVNNKLTNEQDDKHAIENRLKSLELEYDRSKKKSQEISQNSEKEIYNLQHKINLKNMEFNTKNIELQKKMTQLDELMSQNVKLEESALIYTGIEKKYTMKVDEINRMNESMNHLKEQLSHAVEQKDRFIEENKRILMLASEAKTKFINRIEELEDETLELRESEMEANGQVTRLKAQYLELQREVNENTNNETKDELARLEHLMVAKEDILAQRKSEILSLKTDKEQLKKQVGMLLAVCNKKEPGLFDERKLMAKSLENEKTIASLTQRLEQTKNYTIEYKRKGDSRINELSKKTIALQRQINNKQNDLNELISMLKMSGDFLETNYKIGQFVEQLDM